MLFIINPKKTKYSGINLAKHVKHVYGEIINADERNQRCK